MDIMAGAAGNMGENILESFEFMDKHRLYDVQQRPYKAAISFQTYLSEYEAPFVFLSPYGDQATCCLSPMSSDISPTHI